jgi:capsule polysaccharide export protein KpsC/LpsZ
LKLDNRPIVLMATNVLGDSLTLGRQVFTKTMADWVSRTILYFIGRPDIQLVIRIHPGEILTREYSMVDVVRETLPELPEYIHVIHPEEKINTYDLIEITDVGLVYTTTVGLEMALKGLPVVVSGQTHYRNRGFTFDPVSWVEYFKLLGTLLANPKEFRLTKEKIKLTWKYAYHFFYTFPLPFPWHIKIWQDFETHKISQVFSKEGKKKYGNTFRYLVGEPLDWTKVNHNGKN